MTLARGAVALGVVLVAILAVWLFVLRDDGHQYTLIFVNAGQLVKGDNVQIGGRPVGSVKSIALTSDNQAAVKISVQEPYAPLREGTEAVIRLTSLSGIANRYVALSPAPGTNPQLGDGAVLDTSQTTTAVDLDQLFNTLDPKARRDLQGLIKGFSTQYQGKAREADESTKYFNPLLSSARRLVDQATADEGDLTRFLVSSSRAVTTIASKRDDLSALVGNANTTAGAIAVREPGPVGGARAAADHAAAREQHVRQPARDARRPRPAGGRVQGRHQGPGAVPARAAPARARRRADDHRPRDGRAPARPRQRPRRGDAQAARPAEGRQPGVQERHRRAEQEPAGARVRAPVHARAGRLVPRLRRGRRQLRRERPLRAHPADLQRVPAPRADDRPDARAAAGVAAPRRPAAVHAPPLPGHRQPDPARLLGAVPRPERQPRLRSDAGAGRAHEARRSPSSSCSR